MDLTEALKQKRDKILSVWIERTLDSYTSSVFFKQSKDRFANPVGANITEGLTGLYNCLLQGLGPQEYANALDQVIRIRAVQEFSPAQAVAPILELKWVVKQIFSADKQCRDLLPKLDSFDCDVDRAALTAFDLYVESKERLHRARIRELKSGSYILTDSGCASALIKQNLKDISRIS